MTERQTILAGCLYWRRRWIAAQRMLAASGYDTPAGYDAVAAMYGSRLLLAQQRAVRYRRCTAEERDREAIAAWRDALGMDGYDNLAAAE